MAVFVLVHQDSYHDSVLLMRLSEALRGVPGVEDAVVAMGTPQNRALLEAQGYPAAELERAGPNDLVIAAKGGPGAPRAVEAELARRLAADSGAAGEAGGEVRPASLAAALESHPEANLVLISVPGVHAAREARRALRLGRHVMLFSDNVSLEDEVDLKREAAARGLLMMGPDCGTAILDGLPLGFANAVRRGAIGIVGAAGTGIQEISCCIHRLGGGVSQAIGTGGRDLSEAVGGLMMRLGIEALAVHADTRVIVVVSKPPAPAVAEQVVAALAAAAKPGVVHFVGAAPRAGDPVRGIEFADSLAGAAEAACRLAGVPDLASAAPAADPARIAALAARLAPGAALRGLFCGGTTGQEALALLTRAGLEVRSNLHQKGPLRVEGVAPVPGHVLLDLGDDVFTVGRPHPMIEPGLRNERLAVEMRDPGVGLLLFDCVLGYGAHPDPAGVLAAGVEEARAAARARGGEVVAIASVTGTPSDPQDSDAQSRRLEAGGIVVERDNRSAATLAAALLARIG
ncbi:MAG TPA: acyl-CoA synthetase FdrA [Candidatus Saccharimonadales bacterium]|nr:acyl-CoA synthetase FdrA [Candidatus Saccharimonadales bacterium]